jgi:hypothetical protein
MVKVRSSPSRVDHWNTLRGNSWTRCWFRHSSCCLGGSQKYICARLTRTLVHTTTTSNLPSKERQHNNHRTHSNLQRSLWQLISHWKAHTRPRKGFLPSHQPWSSLWNIHNNHVETPQAIILWVGLTTPKLWSKA